jgi:putative glutamine amidotransferase
MLPLIGLTCAPASRGEDRPLVFQLNQAYATAVTRAGGVPVLIPPLGASESLRAAYESVDAILLPGGADLHPSLYGEEPHPTVYGVDAVLDETELALARWALAEEKPIFGICRGQQTLNVAAGGTLIQDIPSQVPAGLTHDLQPRTAFAHPIVVEPDSRLADLFGSRQLEVNSLHHQAVAEVAPGFVVTARAPDGVVEGIERPDHPFAVSVQFHPEELAPGHEASERLLRRFVAAAAGRAARHRAILHQIESR